MSEPGVTYVEYEVCGPQNETLENGLLLGHGVAMAISEAARSDLYTGLRDAIGPQRTETLMSAIPLHDLDEVATKADVAPLRTDMADLRAEMRTEMADLRAEMRTDMADLRTEMAELTKELGTEMGDLRTELKADVAELRNDTFAEIAALRKTMTTWMVTLLVAVIGAMASIGFLS